MCAREAVPLISVIIPVRNGGAAFHRCLQALCLSDYPAWEGIVVNDGSTDDSTAVAAAYGLRVIRSRMPGAGPGRARNDGVELSGGDLLLFVDADVAVRPNTLSRLAQIFARHLEIAACFGSYDDQPEGTNFLSQYKNLQHHYLHQIGKEGAATFWSGCGAVRRVAFLEAGGFTTRYNRPCIEDIELGYRLVAAGYKIRLEKSLLVKHLKEWTAASLVLSDIRDRAIPWSLLMLESGRLTDDLNTQTSQRMSGVLALIGTALVALSLCLPLSHRQRLRLAVPASGAFGALTVLNLPFYRFLARTRGKRFALMAWPWHVLYFLYSTLAFGLSFAWFQIQGRPHRDRNGRHRVSG